MGLNWLLECYTNPKVYDGMNYQRPNTMDLGASVRYSLPIELPVTLFVKGENLLDREHDRYFSYRGLGASFLAGFALSF